MSDDGVDAALIGLWGLMLGIGIGCGLSTLLESARVEGFREGRTALVYALDAERARRAKSPPRPPEPFQGHDPPPEG